MIDSPVRWRPARLVRRGATVAAILVAAGFGLAIVILAPALVGLHEVAGATLLLLIAAASAGALRERPVASRALHRLEVALGVLVGIGGLGAALASGWLPTAYDAAPLLALGPLIGLLLDSLRA
jgi:hypothetical protein